MRLIRGKYSKVLAKLGPGLISAVAGLEITNIGVFTYVGSRYGLAILWAIILSMMVTAFIQQLAAEIGAESRRGLIVEVRERFGLKLLLPFILFLYISNMVTVSLNIAGASMALEALTDIKWPLWALWIVSISMIISSLKSYRGVERVLTALAATLVVYVILAIYYIIQEPHLILNVIYGAIIPDSTFSKDFMIDLLSIFGAAAAAYSLIFQAAGVVYEKIGIKELPEEFMDIMVGVVFTTLASISITIVSALHLASQGIVVLTVHEAVMALDAIGQYNTLLFTIGSVSAALLAIEAINLCNAYVLYEYKTGHADLNAVVKSDIYPKLSIFTVLVSFLIALVYSCVTGFKDELFSEMNRWFSVIISLTSWLPTVIIVALYWRVKVLSSSFLRIIGGILAVALVMVNVIGVIWIVKP